MFLDFYHLREQPFGVTPDPRYLYLSPTHREALASLLYGIQCGRGFLTLIAQPGMGKTTLLFCLLERLRGTARTAYLFQTQATPREFLRQLLTDLGGSADFHDWVAMHQQLNKILLREAENHRQVVVVIDEAQNLSEEVLESVRLLSNFETASTKLIQIVLAGQPPLADKLTRPSLAQLCQRLSIMARLDPFDRTDTDRYIDHRLGVAGHATKDLFDTEARTLIAILSRGIPRLINNLCFNSLSIGCALGKRTIDGSMVREAAADLFGSEGLEIRGVHSHISTAQSKPSPQTPPGGARPHAVPEVLPGMVLRAKRDGTPRWALRTAIFCASLVILSLLPARTVDPQIASSPSRVSTSATLAALRVAPATAATASTSSDAGVGSAQPDEQGLSAGAPAQPPDNGARASGSTAAGGREPATSPRAEQSLLCLRTIPSGATVRIDGELYGRSPVATVLGPGVHTYRAGLPGYPAIERTIQLRPGDTVQKTLAFKAESVALDIRSIPPQARIIVDGVARASTPATLRLETGEHRLEISLQGYRPAFETVKARPGRVVRIYEFLRRQ